MCWQLEIKFIYICDLFKSKIFPTQLPEDKNIYTWKIFKWNILNWIISELQFIYTSFIKYNIIVLPTSIHKIKFENREDQKNLLPLRQEMMWITWHHLYSPILHEMFYFRPYTRSIHPQQYLQWYLDFSLAHQSLWVLTPLSQEFLSHYISSLYYRKYCTISESGFKAAIEDIQINITRKNYGIYDG